MNQYQCPVDDCEASFGEIGSVKAHITRKSDTAHKGLSGPEYWETHGDGESGSKDTPDEKQAAETPDTGSLDFPENPDADRDDSGPGECAHNNVVGLDPGHQFTTSDGRTGITEEGDKWCKDCSGVLAADGEFYP